MERTQSSDSRWRQVIAVQSELEQSMVTLPELLDRDFKPRKVSARTVRFAQALEEVCIKTVEDGDMTKDLALLVGPDQPWLTTNQFFTKVDENLQKHMVDWK